MTSRLEFFSTRLKELAPAFSHELERTRALEPGTFKELGDVLLEWAEAAIGNTWADTLIDGYCDFVVDVNRAQLRYERYYEYENKSFQEVNKKVYSNSEFMRLYHWGVYCSTFIWTHHLRIYQFFQRYFISQLESSEPGRLVDLGSGSGVWHLLALLRLPNWRVTAVDISQSSIDKSRHMAELVSCSNVNHVCADATKWLPETPAQAGISCFLLEHLENPNELMAALANSLQIGGHAFVTGALTAAEIDHIFEFKRESEMIRMVEDAGFRVKHVFSAAPDTTPRTRRYLPRSMALVLQRRQNEFW
jgi:2-polyprenyl-3-methyl-5-hydroxy-6-metoxy-1,4-benzoquinol methylase